MGTISHMAKASTSWAATSIQRGYPWHCAQAGASLRVVQRIAGHADLGTTERYVEPSLEAQRRLIALT